MRRAADLLGHAVPSADLDQVLDRALTLLVEQLERKKYAARKAKVATGVSPAGHAAPRQPEPPAVVPARPAGPAPAGDTKAAATLPKTGIREDPTISAPPALASGDRPATAAAPRTSRSRYIPAAVRREVWARDEGRCSYIGPSGRYRQTRRLEFHHRQPFAEGGPATAENVALTCRVHNRLEAARWFGEDFDRSKRSASAEAPARRGG